MDNSSILELFDSILNWRTWIVLVVVALFGMIGGLAHKLALPPKEGIKPGSYIIVGIVASLAVLFIFNPTTAIKLIALSLVAGYGGKAVLDALEQRVKLAIAQQRTEAMREQGKEAIKVGKRAQQKASQLYQEKIEMEKTLTIMRDQLQNGVFESLAVELPEIDTQSFNEERKKLIDMESTLKTLEKTFNNKIEKGED